MQVDAKRRARDGAFGPLAFRIGPMWTQSGGLGPVGGHTTRENFPSDSINTAVSTCQRVKLQRPSSQLGAHARPVHVLLDICRPRSILAARASSRTAVHASPLRTTS